MKAMPSAKGWRQRSKKTKIVVIHNETAWPVHRPVAAVLLQIWIIETYWPAYGRGVAPDLECVDFLFRTDWPIHSRPVAAVLLDIWNLPNEMTRKQSCCCRGVAPNLEYTVLLQRCCAPDLAYLNFRQDSSWFSSPPVSQVSGLRRISQTSPLSFFSVVINLAISEIWLSSSTYDFSPTNEAQFLDTAV